MSDLQATVPSDTETKITDDVQKIKEEETLQTMANGTSIDQSKAEVNQEEQESSQPGISPNIDAPVEVQEVTHTLHPDIGNTTSGNAVNEEVEAKVRDTKDEQTQATEAPSLLQTDAPPVLEEGQGDKKEDAQLKDSENREEAEEGEIAPETTTFKKEDEQSQIPPILDQEKSNEEPEEGEFEEASGPPTINQIESNGMTADKESIANQPAASGSAVTHVKPEPDQVDEQTLPSNGDLPDVAIEIPTENGLVGNVDGKEASTKEVESIESVKQDQAEMTVGETRDVEMKEANSNSTEKEAQSSEQTSSIINVSETAADLPSSESKEGQPSSTANVTPISHDIDVPNTIPTSGATTAPTANHAPQNQDNSAAATTKPLTTRKLTPGAETSAAGTSGNNAASTGRVVANARQDEMTRMRRETEDMRLLWLSLPSHDHPSYYSDTDEENASSGSSCAADAILPRNANGREPFLSIDLVGESSLRQRQRQDDWIHDLDEDISDVDEDDVARAISKEEKKYRIGNRGNKLKKGSRWVRNGKLGTSTDARNEKDITERFTERLKALQRTQVDSMLQNAQGPPLSKRQPDLLDGSDRLLLRDIHKPPPVSETSILLAPQLLRPILSTRALLQSHTLRHTFRNPHIGALSRTALDLRESESQLSRSLSRCLGAMEARLEKEEDGSHSQGVLSGSVDGVNHHSKNTNEKQNNIDLHAVGAEGTHGDELNPSFAQLDRLFVTKEGLPIPNGGQTGEDGQRLVNGGDEGSTSQGILTTDQQRDVIRAALECLHELDGDSLEYVERLEEVRSRLAAVKQKRLQVWNALRIWALKREGDDIDIDSVGKIANENNIIADTTNVATTNTSSTTRGGGTSSGGAGQGKTTNSNNATGSTKRRRVAA